MRFKYVLFPLLIAIFISGCENTGIKKLSTVNIVINDMTIHVEIARTDQERQTGLMYRKSMGENEGMLFVWDREERRAFYMKNTLIPLSIAFISAEGEILQIEDMQPLDETTVPSRYSVRYALEVNQGAFERWGVKVGDRIMLPEDLERSD